MYIEAGRLGWVTYSPLVELLDFKTLSFKLREVPF